MSVLCQAASTLITCAAFGLSVNYQLSLVTLACMPIIILGVTFQMKIMNSQLAADKEATEKAVKVKILNCISFT